jgi:hypothetical protein
MHRLAHIQSTLSVVAIGLLVLVAVEFSGGSSSSLSTKHTSIVFDDDDLVGLDAAERASNRPMVEAAFRLEGYRPGETARLRFFSSARDVSLEIVHAGTEAVRIAAKDVMAGRTVRANRPIGSVRPGRELSIELGNWPSGLYFARLTAAGGRVGYAPFVLQPRRLGEHRIAVVLSTMTWQAYNFRDDDDDGTPDTWYGDPTRNTARLGRPFENRGVPRHYRWYEQPFLRWLNANGRNVDYFSDRGLNLVSSGAALARAYDLIVFPGHHEYVTTHEYDIVTDFRNRGGNLMFLAANNFFYRVDINGDVMTRVGRWRDVGRPEAQLVGVQYIGWNLERYGSRPYVVRGSSSMPWVFRGTGLHDGDRFAAGGIEIDARAAASPRNVKVLAAIPNVFGPGMTAEMTYYRSPGGAKVFAAGAFSVAASIWNRPMQRIVENLWSRLVQP